MKICIFSDVHWSTYTSIVRQRGVIYSKRLEMLIQSMNWVNELAVKENCDFMICAGDFCDKSTLTDEELTALKEVKWNRLKCYFLVGNHESSVSNLQFTTVDALQNSNHIVINNKYFRILDEANNVVIDFLPYVTESARTEIDSCNDEKRIIVSHNDIKGVQYGALLSKIGYDKDEIDSKCKLYLNGHIHNSEYITDKILNLGSLTAHNFTNDSFKYKYGCWILDTETLKLTFVENPYGLRFYKLVIEKEEDLNQLDSIKDNAVLSIKCEFGLKDKLEDKLQSVKKLTHKTIFYRDDVNVNTESTVKLNTVDHLKQFNDFVLTAFAGDDKIDIVKEELGIILS